MGEVIDLKNLKFSVGIAVAIKMGVESGFQKPHKPSHLRDG
jgi:hypothetical protein